MRFVILFLASMFVATQSAAFDRYTAHGGPIKGLAHSTELNLLVSTSFDYTAVVWDTESMTELKQLIGHNAAVNTATFSPDGQWLATAGDDNQILLWSVSDLKDPSAVPRPVALNGHTAKVIHLEFVGRIDRLHRDNLVASEPAIGRDIFQCRRVAGLQSNRRAWLERLYPLF